MVRLAQMGLVPDGCGGRPKSHSVFRPRRLAAELANGRLAMMAIIGSLTVLHRVSAKALLSVESYQRIRAQPM